MGFMYTKAEIKDGTVVDISRNWKRQLSFILIERPIRGNLDWGQQLGVEVPGRVDRLQSRTVGKQVNKCINESRVQARGLH